MQAMKSSNTPIRRRLETRALISIIGSEARALLQRVITADVDRLEAGQCCPGALLTPQGKILVDFLIFADGNSVWIDILSEQADALVKRLSLYKLRADAVITRCEDLVPVWADTPFDGSAPDPRFSAGVYRGVAPLSDQVDPDTGQLNMLEISQGVPTLGRDYSESSVFPTDVNLDVYGGIGWQKGCFIGQEVVSRMKRRGTIRKRSVAVHFDGDAPAKNTKVSAGEITLGEITSASGQNTIALIRLDKLEKADAPVEANGQPARISVPDALKPDAPAPKV